MNIGEWAPEFRLGVEPGETVSPSTLCGSRVVLLFSPRDDTRGCTAQARDFSAQKAELAGGGVMGFGVPTVGRASHRRFRARHGLEIPLLTDRGGDVADACGVWKEKTLYGRRHFGIEAIDGRSP